MDQSYSTQEIAEKAGVHKDTLLRWLREGKVSEPARDRNGWRKFSEPEKEQIVRYARQENSSDSIILKEDMPIYKTTIPERISKLEIADFDFISSQTGYLTHSIHPYPAKYIPQIPRTIIRELASAGDTVLDPFCGSGTTLVEALRLECHAIGIDANPLACLISKTKTTLLTEDETQFLQNLGKEVAAIGGDLRAGTPGMFNDYSLASGAPFIPNFDGIELWFKDFVVRELAFLKAKCLSIESQKMRDVALTAFSSIIVTISNQDSDTRYVRREKRQRQGDALILFGKALINTAQRCFELGQEVDPKLQVSIVNANILTAPNIPQVDLVVCSPPYPNAYSYHLYHRSRMLWLDMNQPKFKEEEIGSHRKYSSKSSKKATEATFRQEFGQIMAWLSGKVRPGGHAVFIIGDSTLDGKTIENDQILIDAGRENGFRLSLNRSRRLQDSKKSFNPAIGKIREEHILILQNNY
jgi:DNA modification methylase